MPRSHSWVAAGLAIAVLFAPAYLSGAESRPLKRVLIVHSFGEQFEPFQTAAATFRTELSLLSTGPIEFYDVSLETARFSEGPIDEPLAEYLQALCTERRIDLVVPVGAPAFRFCTNHHERLFPEIPVLAAGVEKRHLNGVALGSNATAVTITIDLVGFLEDILHLLPQTTQVDIVIGNSPNEKFWANEMRAAWQRFEDRVEFTWLNDLGLPAIRDRVSALSPGSAIIFALSSTDGAGVPYEQSAALDTLSRAAAAPLFAFFDSEFGQGVVGGRMIDVRALGKISAQVAARILAGEAAGSIPPIDTPLSRPIYDSRALKRWNIDPSLLPLGSDVRYRQPGVWETYRSRLIAVGVLLVLQAGLILILLRNRQRLRGVRAELQKNQENIRLAARSARLSFWTLDVDRDRLWITDEGRVLFGWERTGRVGFDRFLATLRPEDRQPARDRMGLALRSGTDFEAEHRIVLEDGTERWIATRGQAQNHVDGKSRILSGVSMDITSRMQAIQEAQELRRELSHTGRLTLLSQFTASLAHELGQPLGAIQRNADAAEMFLKRNSPDLDEIRNIFSDVRKDCERAAVVIDRLRAMLRRRPIETQDLVWSELAHEAVGIVRADSQARGISLEIEAPLGLPRMKGDRVHLEQVLINLMANAMDAIDTSPNGERRVTLSARANGNGTVECSVKDTGPGIPSECLSSIFDPFVTTKPNGMGMGLPICQTIIETLGGRLWAENNPGQGATFHFTVPVADS